MLNTIGLSSMSYQFVSSLLNLVLNITHLCERGYVVVFCRMDDMASPYKTNKFCFDFLRRKVTNECSSLVSFICLVLFTNKLPALWMLYSSPAFCLALIYHNAVLCNKHKLSTTDVFLKSKCIIVWLLCRTDL